MGADGRAQGRTDTRGGPVPPPSSGTAYCLRYSLVRPFLTDSPTYRHPFDSDSLPSVVDFDDPSPSAPQSSSVSD